MIHAKEIEPQRVYLNCRLGQMTKKLQLSLPMISGMTEQRPLSQVHSSPEEITNKQNTQKVSTNTRKEAVIWL